MNYNIQIKLSKLKGAKVVYQDGVEGIFIPINDEIGTVVAAWTDSLNVCHQLSDVTLNIGAFEMQQDKQLYSTHILKPSFSKEVFSKMSEEVQKRIPIIGSMSSWDFKKKRR